VYISINIQSLQSKYEQFLQEINELEQKGIEIEVIALQEIWDMKYPELFPLPGYKPLICKTRVGMRGGGVGFYIKNHINYQLLNELSPFENKIIEALTIRATCPDNKSVLLSCIYRSNGPIHNVPAQEQFDRFILKFDELLSNIQNKNEKSYVFLDSNVDLLKLNQQNAANYFN
jgi:exonuclease III